MKIINSQGLKSLNKKVSKLLTPTGSQVQFGLFMLGVVLITAGIFEHADAAYSRVARYNDDRVAESVDVLLAYINGAFGALIMVISGVGAIMSCAFGQYKAALGLLAVAVGSFVLRTLVATWFNDTSLQNNTIRGN